MKITELPKDIDLTAAREEWLAVGLSTEPADWEEAEAGVADAYRAAGLEPPGLIVRVGSPWAGAVAQSILCSPEGQAAETSYGHPSWGQHDAGWLAWHAVLCPLIGEHRLDGLIRVARSAGWWWPLDGAVVISDRPCELHRDATGRLHREDGPALLYRDGWGVYAWHGIRVPDWVIDHPERISVETIDAEVNAEQRRVQIERYGWQRYLTDSSAVPLDKWVDEGGQLVRLYDVEGARRLHLINSTADPDGTRREYVLRVPTPEHPSAGEWASVLDTAHGARNWCDQLPPGATYTEVS